MARLAPSRDTLIALFAKSGNLCAFPGCTHELVTGNNLFVGQVCHIEAANPGGQRYNAEATDESRRSFDNLILLCYRHHRETDNVDLYPASTLRTMKHTHEMRYGAKPFKVNEAFLYRVEAEMETYWSSIAHANANEHIAPEFAVSVPVGLSATQQFAGLAKSVERIRELLSYFADCDAGLDGEIQTHLASLGYNLAAYSEVPYYKNPFSHRNWEMHVLAANNAFTDLIVELKTIEVRFLEEFTKTHPNDIEAIQSLESAKAELHRLAVSTGYAD